MSMFKVLEFMVPGWAASFVSFRQAFFGVFLLFFGRRTAVEIRRPAEESHRAFNAAVWV